MDELVRRTKIPKGTFYLFYPSKEALLFDVIRGWYDRIQEEIAAAAASLSEGPMDADRLTDTLFSLFQHGPPIVKRCIKAG